MPSSLEKEDRPGSVPGEQEVGSWLLRIGCILRLKGEDDRAHEAAVFSSSVHQGKEERGIWTQTLLRTEFFGYNVPFILSQTLADHSN